MTDKQEKLIDIVLDHERRNTVSTTDKSQEVFYGIKRRKYPRWIGWKFIDKNRYPNGKVDITDDIEMTVRRFYVNQFYVPLRISEVENMELSAHLLDFAAQTDCKTVVRILRNILNEMTDGETKKNGGIDDELFEALASVDQEELTELVIVHRNMYCKDHITGRRECRKCEKRVVNTTRSVQPSIFVKMIKLAHEKGWLQTIWKYGLELFKAGRTRSTDMQYEEG